MQNWTSSGNYFCKDPFWDSQLSWNNTWPQMTQCFQSAFLLPLPCIYLWVFLPFHFYYLSQRPEREVKMWRTSLALKMVCCLTLCTTEIGSVILRTLQYLDDQPLAPLVEGVIKFTSYILVTLTILQEHRKSCFRSLGLLLFFFILLVTHVVPFYSKLILQEYVTHPGAFALFYIQYTAIVGSVVLHCFNNRAPHATNTVPEEQASILSTLTIWWTTRLVIQGYRKPLKEEDIYPLSSRERAGTVVPAFLHYLSLHTKRWQSRNKVVSKVQTSARYRKADEVVDTSAHPPLIKNSEVENGDESHIKNGGLISDDLTVTIRDGADKNEGKGLGVFLLKVILQAFGKQIIMCGCVESVVLVCTLTSPIIMKHLIEFTSNEEEPQWHGYLLAVVLFLLSALGHSLFEFYLFWTNKFAIRIKTALISAIYRKSLCLSSEARQSCSSGEIIHLLSKDCDSMWNLCIEGFMLLESPIELIVGIILVYYTVGTAMFSGLAAMGGLFLLKTFTVRKHTQYDQELREHADERMKIASQVLGGIKVFKLYAWEDAFKALMCAVREKELRAIFKYDLFRFFITFAWTAAIFWMIFFTFLTYIYVDESHHLTASTVFVTMTYFTYIRRSSNSLATVVDVIIAGINAARRIAKFLTLKEVEKSTQSQSKSEVPQDSAVTITNGYFSWTSTTEPVLRNINLDIPQGSLTAIVGMVGSGKSSLMSAILGEMVACQGTVHKRGTIAYIPQQAWIQNDSLRNNVLFGEDDREEDYNQVIQACALEADLSILPAGDQTEIGEKGINLSGGQKQRVSLARAVYQQSDIYLLDDPLSAVDSHVGQHIFQHVIGKDGILKDKTRILVTHGIHWLPHVDRILVLTNGQLTEQGSFEQLMAHNGPFAQFLSQYLYQQQRQHQKGGDERTAAVVEGDAEEDARHGSGDSQDMEAVDDDRKRHKMFERLLSIESEESETAQGEDIDAVEGHTLISKTPEAAKLKDDDDDMEDETARLILEEEMASGRVNWSVYSTFGRHMGLVSVAVLIFQYVLFYIFDTAAGFWLTFWVDDALLNNDTLAADSPIRAEQNTFYVGIYSLWGLLETLVIVIYTLLKAFRHIHASRNIHDTLITKILASPIQFFDTTPVGRVLARISKDISVVDTTLLLWMEIWGHAVLAVFAVILTIVINIPIFLVVVIPVVLLFYIIERFYLPTSCQLRRLESKWLSPVFSFTSESLAGSNVIRALGHQDRFIQTAEEKIDFCQKMKYSSLACERWLSIRLGLLSDVLVLFAGLLAVTYRNDLSPGLTGLCLSLVLIITEEMQLQVRIASFMEMDIVSVERILQYKDLPSEAPRQLPCPEYSESWPQTGNMSFVNVCVRYRRGLELVLKHVSFDVKDGEKIGIVGRTGAGKSSLMLSLFRLLELSEGSIIVDGLNISKLGLYQLRQRLTILPQDPVLFTGSLRSNFDPFEQFSDDEIWKSIEHCHLKSFVDSLPQGLEFPVGEGGDNLSIGQRQLVCLGRALLRKTKILVLDEATAAVDMETDELIQRTIRKEFHTSTVLTIAHRLHTIMDYDRILVLDQGCVVEFDAPATLLNNPSSSFYQMAVETQALPRSCLTQSSA